MVQAAVLDGLVFDASPFSEDGFAETEVDISWCEFADTLVVSVVVVVVDEGGDGGLKFPPEEVVFQQDAAFQCLVPTLDLALGLRIHRRATDALHAFVFVIFRQIPRDVGRAIITQKPGIVQNSGTVAA